VERSWSSNATRLRSGLAVQFKKILKNGTNLYSLSILSFTFSTFYIIYKKNQKLKLAQPLFSLLFYFNKFGLFIAEPAPHKRDTAPLTVYTVQCSINAQFVYRPLPNLLI
jgi:hypothetical protein